MFTINDYINSLKNDKNTLVANLTTKGITGLTGAETFTELAPKVLDITSVNNQSKSVTITSNTTTTIEADSGYTGLSSVSVTTAIPLPSGTINITTNGTHDVTNYASANVNVQSDDWTTSDFAFATCICFIKRFPTVTMPSIALTGFFSGAKELVEISPLDISATNNVANFCNGCSKLTTVPVFNIPLVVTIANMFNGCTSLTDTSLDNILQTCISATSFTGTKTLSTLGLYNATVYPASRIQALPHYQDFLNAGWTIGWS